MGESTTDQPGQRPRTAKGALALFSGVVLFRRKVNSAWILLAGGVVGPACRLLR